MFNFISVFHPLVTNKGGGGDCGVAAAVQVKHLPLGVLHANGLFFFYATSQLGR